MKNPNLWRYWLPLPALSLFISRCLYELNPIQFMPLADWLNVLFIVVGTVIVARVGLNVARRRFTGFPPDLSPLLLLLVYVVWPQVDLLWALILLLGASALIAAQPVLPRLRWFDAAIGLTIFALYLITLGDHVGQADTFEFQVVAPQLGIAHPTGYPLFVGVSKLFSLLPINSMAWRVNLSSAILGAIAVWLIYRTIVALTSDRLAAALAGLALAAAPVLWSQAVVAEVYALNALFVSAILFLLIRLLSIRSSLPVSLRNSAERAAWRQLPTSNIYLLFFLFGLALSHHLTSVILIPAILIT
ncbi:MAG TPA: DUF2723 domain-containing protein, partial [Anaerolineae bacterium]|nr:DUF2723 domain-containing protein [Anaerolineae bacterium]